jgi:DNA-binding response OmpR family regulator
MHKILIVEDELAIARMYQFKLEHSGYKVRCAYNGEAGLAAVEEFKPDLILLDLRMPVMSGDEMLEKLRHEKWGATIRVIVLTNISKDEAPTKLRFLSVDRYIVKAHYTPAQVVQVVEEVLASSANHK